MAYNYFPNNYPAAFVPQYQNYQQSQPQAQAPQNLIWVQGEAGAKSYLVAPNSTVTLWDTESQTIYIKSADASGMPTMKVLDYTLRGGAPEVQRIEVPNNFATKDDVVALRDEFAHLKERVDALGKE